MALEQLESEILKLPPHDFRKLADWLAERDQDRWSRQLEQNVAAGQQNDMRLRASAVKSPKAGA